jgi:hypothetical protein
MITSLCCVATSNDAHDSECPNREKLAFYPSVTRGRMYACIYCGIDATGGFDNGFVTVLPYPHTAQCPTRTGRGF